MAHTPPGSLNLNQMKSSKVKLIFNITFNGVKYAFFKTQFKLRIIANSKLASKCYFSDRLQSSWSTLASGAGVFTLGELRKNSISKMSIPSKDFVATKILPEYSCKSHNCDHFKNSGTLVKQPRRNYLYLQGRGESSSSRSMTLVKQINLTELLYNPLSTFFMLSCLTLIPN